jgi:hypothetical protein
MYAGWITMKNQRVYSDITEIYSITSDGLKLNTFDGKEPAVEVTYNYNGCMTHTAYKTTILYLSEIWIIGKQYYQADEGDQYLYVDDKDVNHENAKKSFVSDKIKYCRRCHSHNVPSARVASLCDNCLRIVPENKTGGKIIVGS